MATANQNLGEKGEKFVKDNCDCPQCKRSETLKQLRVNFKCVDLICDFCGFLAQVKTATVSDLDKIPRLATPDNS